MSEEYKNDELCKSNGSQVAENATISATMSKASQNEDNEKALKPAKHRDSSHKLDEGHGMMSYRRRLERSFDNDAFYSDINATDDSFDYLKLSHKTSYNPTDVDHYVNDSERDNASRVIPERNHNICSSVSDFYCHLRRIAGEARA